MKRKLLSLILVAAMLASMLIFVPTASATESKATFEFGDAVGTANETVTVDFKVTTDALAGVQFMFEYDASRLTFDGIEWTTECGGAGFPVDLTANTVLGPLFTAQGPYRILGWATGIGVGAVDLSAGVVMATLTFTIKEDAPLGDAKVAFAPLYTDYGTGKADPNFVDTGAGIYYENHDGAVTFVDGKVTVIPADYTSALETTDADWDFEDGVIYGMLNEAAIDYTGTIVIPSEIGGVAVTEIAAAAFDGYMASTIVVPASVEYIAAGAIYNCTNLTSVYVLNAAAEIIDVAIGYEGSWRSGAVRNPAIILNADETGALTTIYGAEGSTAAAYAAAGDGVDFFPFVASAGLNSISFADQSYLVGATTKAPGSMVIDGKTVIGWTDGEKTYAVGSTIEMNGALALEPVTITAPQTATDVDFKLSAGEAGLAMRFTSSMSIEDYEALAELGTVQLGMLITPAKRVSQAGAFTKEALDALEVTHKYVDIEIGGYYEKTATDYIFAGSLKGFSASTLAKNPDFAAILYATVTTEAGDVFTVYGDFNFDANQDVKSVATGLSTSADLTDTEKGWLTTLVGKFTA